jgi:hypothetical protein
MARLEPSPSSDTQEPASPAGVDAALRPRGQVDQADGDEVEVVSGPELLK